MLRYHPIADLFPLMTEAALDDLVDDIRRHGLREPIWLYQQQVLDGRNRLRACQAADVTPVFREYDGDDPLNFVVSLNLHRRHLSESQRAMVASKVANRLVGQFNSANLQNCKTTDEAAEIFNVSERSIYSAKTVRRQGIPELIQKVEAGDVKVSVAADVAGLPEEEQRYLVALNEKAILNAARDIRSEKAQRRHDDNERLRQAALALPLPEGQYRCIVMDPPWPMQKIQRDVCPQQTPELDYPVMTLGQIADLRIPAADQCHLYLWTTQKFLWAARELLQYWGFDHLAVMVWHKPGGFQPAGLPQFNCEFVLMGRRGALAFNTTRDFPLCFQAPRRQHSRKPDVFYERVARVSPGPRLDMFSREARPGFTQFGIESDVF